MNLNARVNVNFATIDVNFQTVNVNFARLDVNFQTVTVTLFFYHSFLF